MRKYNKDLFAVAPAVYRLIIISLVLAAYYYIDQNGLFPQWSAPIYYAVKVIIAYQIIVGGLRTFVLPAVTLIAGLACIVAEMFYNVALLPTMEVWQIIIVSVVSIVIAIFTQL